MDAAGLGDLLRQGLLAGAFLAIPLLVLAAGIGFTFAIIQATMQLQDSSLQLALKIIVAGIILYVFGHKLAAPLLEFTSRVFRTTT